MNSPQSDDKTTAENWRDPGGFMGHFDLERLESGNGRAKHKMVVQERHLRMLGIMHGGVTATLLDSVMGNAAWTVSKPDHHVVTVQMNLNYIRPVWEGETLFATGEVLHGGSQTLVTRGEVHNGDGTLIATATATFMQAPHPKGMQNIPRKSDDAKS